MPNRPVARSVRRCSDSWRRSRGHVQPQLRGTVPTRSAASSFLHQAAWRTASSGHEECRIPAIPQTMGSGRPNAAVDPRSSRSSMVIAHVHLGTRSVRRNRNPSATQPVETRGDLLPEHRRGERFARASATLHPAVAAGETSHRLGEAMVGSEPAAQLADSQALPSCAAAPGSTVSRRFRSGAGVQLRDTLVARTPIRVVR